MTKYVQGNFKQDLSESQQIEYPIISLEDDIGLTEKKRQGSKFEAGSIQQLVALFAMLMTHYDERELRYILPNGGNDIEPLKGLLYKLGRWENGFINLGGRDTILESSVCMGVVAGDYQVKASEVLTWVFDLVDNAVSPAMTLLDPYFTDNVNKHNQSVMKFLHSVYTVLVEMVGEEEEVGEVEYNKVLSLFSK